MKYVIGNWKSHKTMAEVHEWIDAYKKAVVEVNFGSDLQVVLCPSFVHLSVVKWALPDLTLGLQTLSPYSDGSYTGAVSARMVREYAQFAILGHTERRKYFGETDRIVANQALQAFDFNITPIIAVDQHNWSSQLGQLDDAQLLKCLVMYEPPEAISSGGQGHAADLEEVKKAIHSITTAYNVMGVLYGGSVNSQNVQTYLAEKEIMGVVPGAASLDAAEFVKLLQAAAATL